MSWEDELKRQMSSGLPTGRNKMRPLSDFTAKKTDANELKRQAEISELIKEWIKKNSNGMIWG